MAFVLAEEALSRTEMASFNVSLALPMLLSRLPAWVFKVVAADSADAALLFKAFVSSASVSASSVSVFMVSGSCPAVGMIAISLAFNSEIPS